MYALSASCVSLLRALLCTWIVWLNGALMWMHCVDAFLARTQRNRFQSVSRVWCAPALMCTPCIGRPALGAGVMPVAWQLHQGDNERLASISLTCCCALAAAAADCSRPRAAATAARPTAPAPCPLPAAAAACPSPAPYHHHHPRWPPPPRAHRCALVCCQCALGGQHQPPSQQPELLHTRHHPHGCGAGQWVHLGQAGPCDHQLPPDQGSSRGQGGWRWAAVWATAVCWVELWVCVPCLPLLHTLPQVTLPSQIAAYTQKRHHPHPLRHRPLPTLVPAFTS